MLHAGLDLSRNRLDVCLLSKRGELVEGLAVPSDRDGVRGLARRVLTTSESADRSRADSCFALTMRESSAPPAVRLRFGA
jgi:hypothetical protein